MALNLVYLGDPRNNREREVGADVQPGTPVLVDTDRPAVTLTASGGSTKSFTTPQGYTLSGVPNGGVGNREDYATVAVDGTYEFEVTGVTTSTDNGVAVYLAADGTLTTTATDNDLFGYTDYPPDYAKRAGVAPVRIGA